MTSGALLSPELEAEIRTVILSLVDVAEVDRIAIEVREDSTGDEAIYVDVWHRLSPADFDPRLMSRTHHAVLEALRTKDTSRYAYVRHHLQDGQKVKRAA
jgi:hypothetical protein